MVVVRAGISRPGDFSRRSREAVGPGPHSPVTTATCTVISRAGTAVCGLPRSRCSAARRSVSTNSLNARHGCAVCECRRISWILEIPSSGFQSPGAVRPLTLTPNRIPGDRPEDCRTRRTAQRHALARFGAVDRGLPTLLNRRNAGSNAFTGNCRPVTMSSVGSEFAD